MFQRHQWPKDLLAKDDARRRALHGIKKPHSVDNPAAPYDHAKRVERADKLSTLPKQVTVKKRRRYSGTFMSPEARAAVSRREAAREAFFKSI